MGLGDSLLSCVMEMNPPFPMGMPPLRALHAGMPGQLGRRRDTWWARRGTHPHLQTPPLQRVGAPGACRAQPLPVPCTGAGGEAMCGISRTLGTRVCAALTPRPPRTVAASLLGSTQGAPGIPQLGKSSGYQPPAVGRLPGGAVGCLLGVLRGACWGCVGVSAHYLPPGAAKLPLASLFALLAVGHRWAVPPGHLRGQRQRLQLQRALRASALITG